MKKFNINVYKHSNIFKEFEDGIEHFTDNYYLTNTRILYLRVINKNKSCVEIQKIINKK
jgi:hypothetical protein